VFYGGIGDSGAQHVICFSIEVETRQALSWTNVAIGTRLYDGTFKHEETVVGIDRPSGIIRVKYVRSGDVEPKPDSGM